jgi:hypothetical protein
MKRLAKTVFVVLGLLFLIGIISEHGAPRPSQPVPPSPQAVAAPVAANVKRSAW